MNQKERMLAGLPYKAWLDGLTEEREANKVRIWRYNQFSPADRETRDKLIREIIGKCGKSVSFEVPFHCDYGWNIEVGENFYANYNCTILDVGHVKIGKNVMFACRTCRSSRPATPVHPDSRNSGYGIRHPRHDRGQRLARRRCHRDPRRHDWQQRRNRRGLGRHEGYPRQRDCGREPLPRAAAPRLRKRTGTSTLRTRRF